MPPTSRSGIAAQALSMLNWDANTHVEPASDPTLTGAVSFGSEIGDKRREADFAFPAVNGDKGLVLQSGYSTFFFFSARLYLHGTSHLALLDEPASPPLALQTVSSDVTDLIASGILAIEPEEQAPECQRVTVSMESQTPEMSPARLKVDTLPVAHCSFSVPKLETDGSCFAGPRKHPHPLRHSACSAAVVEPEPRTSCAGLRVLLFPKGTDVQLSAAAGIRSGSGGGKGSRDRRRSIPVSLPFLRYSYLAHMLMKPSFLLQLQGSTSKDQLDFPVVRPRASRTHNPRVR